MKYHILSTVLICAAMILYMTGAMARRNDLGAFLLAVGFSCEFLFWIRVLRIKAQKGQKVALD